MTIHDQWTLVRRIHPKWIVDDNAGGRKLSRQAFEDLGGSVSVYVHERIIELGLDDDVVLVGHPGYGLLSLVVGDARACELGVAWDRVPEDLPRGDAHAGIMGNKTPKRRRKLVDCSEVRVWPAVPTT